MPEPVDTYPFPDHGWTCFHCGEEFSVARQKSHHGALVAAREHFGARPDSEPLCKLSALGSIELSRRVRQAEADAVQFRDERDSANDEAESAQSALSSLSSRFKGANSVYDAWCMYHSMEGRALAAEAIIAEVEKLAPTALEQARDIVCHPPPLEVEVEPEPFLS